MSLYALLVWSRRGLGNIASRDNTPALIRAVRQRARPAPRLPARGLGRFGLGERHAPTTSPSPKPNPNP